MGPYVGILLVYNLLIIGSLVPSHQSSNHGPTAGSGPILIVSLLEHATVTVTKGFNAWQKTIILLFLVNLQVMHPYYLLKTIVSTLIAIMNVNIPTNLYHR